MTDHIAFIVPGEPVGKGRPRFRKGGFPYTPKETVVAEEHVRACWGRAGGERLDGPIRAIVQFVMRRPQNHRRVSGDLSAAGLRAAHPVKKPDLDNALKLVLDSLNERAYKDDAQVVDARAVRRWANAEEGEQTIVWLEPM